MVSRFEIMCNRSQNSFQRFRLAGCALALMAFAGPAMAVDQALERERLAAALRQLSILNAFADVPDDGTTAPSRYHFDYRRLRDDLQRMRSGIEDYLTPKRAQPRDLSQIADTYRLDAPVKGTP